MKLQKYFLAVAFFAVAMASAQVRDYGDYNLVRYNDALDRGGFMSEDEIASIKGSPYENGGVFLPGNVYKDDKKVMSNVLMRYNAYSDHIQTTTDGKKVPTGIMLKDPGAIVEIGAKNYIFFPQGTVPGKGGYLELVSENAKASLYKRNNVTYVKGTKGRDSYTVDKPARFVDEITYYMVDKNAFFTILPQSKRKILEAFGSKEKEMKKYMKTNKLDIGDELDLAKLVSHYCSL